MTGTLEGRVAIVTGASRGIGEAIARRFGQEGAAVAVAARTQQQSDERLPGTIHDTVRAITGSGGRAIAVQADLSKQEDRERVIETTRSELGTPDILVSNAAVTYFIPVEDFPESRYRLMFEVQVRAPFEMAQAVIAGMKDKGAGWILNISSGAARHPQGPPFRGPGRGGTVYGMVKAALERFTTGLASEVYESNIAVNALSPSNVVATPGVLLHRLVDSPNVGEPVEVMAEASLALCSGDPKQLTGRIAYSQALLDELGRTAVPIT